MRHNSAGMAHSECMGPWTEELPLLLWLQRALSPPGADESTRRAMEQRSLGHAMHTHLVEFLRAFLRTPGLEVGCCDPELPILHLLHGYIDPGRLSLGSRSCVERMHKECRTMFPDWLPEILIYIRQSLCSDSLKHLGYSSEVRLRPALCMCRSQRMRR